MAILCLAGDADRGSLGVGTAAVEIICHDVSLHCLDVIDNPGLEKLDLRKCQTPFHLTVRGCPHLGLVLLPENGMGAVVHWDFGTGAAAACTVIGPVRQFDSCQDDGRTTRVIARDSGFASALIVLSDAPLPECSAPTELLICLAHSAQYVGSWIGAQNRLREAVFNGTDIGPYANFDAPLLRAMTIEGTPSLESLKVPPFLEALEIIDSPRIAHVMASGKRLRIEGGCAPDLRIHGGWDFGQFCKTSSRLAPAMVKHLAADRCRHIRPDHLSLENATNPLAVLPDRDCILDPKWRGLMLDFVMHTANRASILPALKLARALYDTGLPAVDAWHARTCLYANLGQANPTRRDAIDWVWHTPRDLAAEVYEADLVLGLACWGGDIAEQFGLMQKNMDRTIQMAAVLRLARGATLEMRDLLLAAVRKSVDAIIIGQTWINGNEERPQQMAQSMALMLEALVMLRSHGDAMAILARLPDLVTRLMRPVNQLAPLVALAALGLSQARAALMSRARAEAEDDPALAAQFHAAALQPAKAALLSHIQIEEISFGS